MTPDRSGAPDVMKANAMGRKLTAPECGAECLTVQPTKLVARRPGEA
jgi:hypothetical protein